MLRKRSEPVPETEISSKEIKRLVRDMYDTMKDAGGIGLAAPQIGVCKRVVVVGFEENERYPEIEEKIEFHTLINPEIEYLDTKVYGFWEGCLSVPNMRGYVERPRKIKLRWNDENGDFHEKILEEMEAVVYQHECDHLDGVLYIDCLKSPLLFGFCDELEKIQESP